MYKINIRDDKNQIITILTESMNYSVRKQENIIITSIHTFIPIDASIGFAELFTPKLSTKVHIDIFRDNDLLLNIDNLILDNFNIGVHLDIKDEFSLQFKNEVEECLG